MLSSFMRLLAIAVTVVILTIFALFCARQMGLHQTFEAPPHPWFKQAFWWIYDAPAAEFCGSATKLDKSLPSHDWIVTLPIKRDHEDWLVKCPEPVLLKDFLSRMPHVNWMLRIDEHGTWGMDKLSELLRSFEDKDAFGVATEAQKVSIYMRANAAEALYAADEPTLLRFRMFETLWIETAMDFPPDFVRLSPELVKEVDLDGRSIEELRRRKKRLIWIWDGKSVPPFTVDGVETTDPAAALKQFPH